MIQRIQSLFLLLASFFFLGEFVFPFFKSEQTSTGFFSDSLFTIQDHPILLGLTVLGGLISFITIFLFNNRSLQQKLVILAIILAIGLPIAALFLGMSDTPTLLQSTSPFIGTFLPLGAIIMLFLSLRGIKKDDSIVKSMDRLR